GIGDWSVTGVQTCALPICPVETPEASHCAPAIADEDASVSELPSMSSLKPLGQLRESFILAVNHDGLWIIDQHVAHERVLFEKRSEERRVGKECRGGSEGA